MEIIKKILEIIISFLVKKQEDISPFIIETIKEKPMKNMKRPDLINQLKRHEGLVLHAYRCSANRWTIGYGRNLQDKGLSNEEKEMFGVEKSMDMLTRKITKAQATKLLTSDVAEFEASVISKVSFFDELDSVRQDILINMAFNMGINRLMKFKNMLGKLKEHDYQGSADEMKDSKWYVQVGIRSSELYVQMVTGEYV